MRERGSKTRQKLEELALESGIELRPAIEAEGREAVREIVASGGGIGFVSAAEFGQDSRLAPIPIEGPEMLMDEALICLRERNAGKLVRAFFDMREGGHERFRTARKGLVRRSPSRPWDQSGTQVRRRGTGAPARPISKRPSRRKSVRRRRSGLHQREATDRPSVWP